MANEIMTVPSTFSRTLDALKKVTKEGLEYWLARDLQGVLGYDTWQNFVGVVDKAKAACAASGAEVANHFSETTKMVPVGSGATRGVSDWFFTRYACYLIAMNGDSTKPEIAFAQTYFAIQTRRQELADQASRDDERIDLRDHVRVANRNLSGVAQSAGVVRHDIFQDGGIRALYGGLGVKDVKARKGIEPKHQLLDRAGSTELAAHFFRATQARERLINDDVKGQEAATRAHREVGDEVRATMRRAGRTMPEDLPAEAPIQQVRARRRKALKAATQKKLPPPQANGGE